MKYTLTRVNPESPQGLYPMETQTSVADPMDDEVHKTVFMGKLEDMIHGVVNWGRSNSLWPYNLSPWAPALTRAVCMIFIP